MKKKVLKSDKNLIDFERIIRDWKNVKNLDVNEEILKYRICKHMWWTYPEFDATSDEDIKVLIKIISSMKFYKVTKSITNWSSIAG